MCATTVAIGQNMLLAPRTDIDHIIAAIRKLKDYSGELAKLESA